MLNQDKHKLVMFQILTEIFKDASLASVLGFKGGTACFFFYDLPRFSVDLDFDLILKESNEEKINIISQKLEKIFKNANLKIKDKTLKRNTVFFLLSYEEESHNIKIEISKRDFPNTYEIKDFYGLTAKVLTRPDIFAHKLVAATDRKKITSRDFFDILYFFKQRWTINEEIIILRTQKTLKEYLKYLANFIEKNLTSKNVLLGLGELLDEKQKIQVKNDLKKDLLKTIDFYLTAR